MVRIIGFFVAAAVLAGSSFGYTQEDVQVERVKAFDGRLARCEGKYDEGGVAYTLRNPIGTIRGAEFEVTVEIETFACVEKQGAMVFQAVPLLGRFVNALGGYVQFKNLEFVVYTPDFSVIVPVALDQNLAKQNSTARAPVSVLKSLSAEAIASAGESRVFLFGFIRGIAETGDATTGKVFDSGLRGFGEFNFLLSESNGRLKSSAAIN